MYIFSNLIYLRNWCTYHHGPLSLCWSSNVEIQCHWQLLAHYHGRRQRETGEGVVSLRIFIHGTDKVEGGLMVLFFGLVLFRWPPGNFSADALAHYHNIVDMLFVLGCCSSSSFEPDVVCSVSVVPLQHKSRSVCTLFVRLGYYNG